MWLTKEGQSVLSTLQRHLSFLDSDLVADAVSGSTFDVKDLRKPGMTVYIHIPPERLLSQRGLLRCWLSAMIRAIGTASQDSEVLFLLDEASALENLPAIEEALVRGRSGGVRMLLVYQSDAQVMTAVKGKPSLLYDNCGTQVYLGASSIESAERLEKSLGQWTQVVESGGDSESRSWQPTGDMNQGQSRSQGSSRNWAVQARSLLQASEILRLDDRYLIAFFRGKPPLLARRLKWYADPFFNPALRRPVSVVWWLLAAAALGGLIYALWQ